MWDLGCDVMVGQRRNEADDSVWETKAHRNQIGCADRWKFRQPVDASAHLLDDALVPERIEHIACDAVLDSFAHSELATVTAEDVFGPIFHFGSRQNVTT
jgi:hypothetical protein